MAEVTLADGAAMKQIAEDSKQIAIMTRRDSTDMRIIAAVTLIFLPCTFTAVGILLPLRRVLALMMN